MGGFSFQTRGGCLKRILLISLVFLLCTAPVLISQSEDCSRWFAIQYAQAKRAHVARLLAIKRWNLVHGAPPVKRKVVVHPRLTPLQALRRFQVVCGDLNDTPRLLNGLLPPEVLLPPNVTVDIAKDETPSFVFPPSTPVGVTPKGPNDSNQPVLPPFEPIPVVPVAFPGPFGGPIGVGPITGPTVPVGATPEPTSWMLLLSGLCGLILMKRKVLPQ